MSMERCDITQDCHCAVIKGKGEHFVTLLISKEKHTFLVRYPFTMCFSMWITHCFTYHNLPDQFTAIKVKPRQRCLLLFRLTGHSCQKFTGRVSRTQFEADALVQVTTAFASAVYSHFCEHRGPQLDGHQLSTLQWINPILGFLSCID